MTLGLRSFTTFDSAREFARRYGCEPRRTGRTTETLCAAMAAATSGKTVVLYLATTEIGRRLQQTAQRLLARAPFLEGVRDGVLRFTSGGELHFVASRQRVVGVRVDAEFRDHYAPAAYPRRASCLHRVRRAKRRCAACGLKLREKALLKPARRREYLRQKNPNLFRELGIPALERVARGSER